MNSNTEKVSSLPVVHTSKVDRTAGRLHQLVLRMNLSVAQREDVVFLVTEYQSNVPTIRRMLDWGLTLPQMQVLFEAREFLRDRTDNVSLRILYRFVEEFSLSWDAEEVSDKILEVKDTCDPRGQMYLDQILARVINTKVEGLIRDPLLVAEFLLARGAPDDNE